MRSTLILSVSVALWALVLVGSAVAQTSISSQMQFQASANVSLSSDLEAQFAYRYVNFIDLSTDVLGQQAFFVSTASTGSASGAGGSVSTDALVGGIYINLGSIPVNWLAWYSASANFGTSVDNFDVSAAGNYILSAYPLLRERNPAGDIVRDYPLIGKLTMLDITKTLTWTKVESSTNGDIKYLSVKGTDSAIPNFSITFTFIVSTKLGFLEYGNTFVHPRSIETVVEIRGYPYANPANTLSLVVYAGSGSAVANGKEFISTLSSSKVYLKFAGSVSVDGTDQAVKIGAWADVAWDNSKLPLLTNLKNQLEGKFSGSYSLKSQEITFPAGANVIIYDPTVGEGQPIGSSAAVTQVISMIAMAALALLAVMFM